MTEDRLKKKIKKKISIQREKVLNNLYHIFNSKEESEMWWAGYKAGKAAAMKTKKNR